MALTVGPDEQPAGTPDVFVARQPIFTRSKAVYGYELLYRSGRSPIYDGTHADYATLAVIDSEALSMAGGPVR